MKKKIIAVVIFATLAVGLVGCGSSADDASGDDPTVYEIESTVAGSESVGEYSILELPKADATMEYLSDWYINYVIPSGHNWDIIVYSDRDDDLGVWANSTMMCKDVYLVASESAGYTQGGNSDTSAYYEMIDEELTETWNAEELGSAEGKDPEEVLQEYLLSGDYYPARWDFIDELEYEGYTTEEAEAAVASFKCDWNELAVEDLETWYDVTGDVDEAIDQLRDDDFTEDEIEYALDQLGLSN